MRNSRAIGIRIEIPFELNSVRRIELKRQVPEHLQIGVVLSPLSVHSRYAESRCPRQYYATDASLPVYFLDNSAFVKLYVQEPGTDRLLSLINDEAGKSVRGSGDRSGRTPLCNQTPPARRGYRRQCRGCNSRQCAKPYGDPLHSAGNQRDRDRDGAADDRSIRVARLRRPPIGRMPCTLCGFRRGIHLRMFGSPIAGVGAVGGVASARYRCMKNRLSPARGGSGSGRVLLSGRSNGRAVSPRRYWPASGGRGLRRPALCPRR